MLVEFLYIPVGQADTHEALATVLSFFKKNPFEQFKQDTPSVPH